jgi:transcriptional regulator with XRE-family HTH domain
MKKACNKLGMSQGDICRALDLDRAYISNIENGKQNFTISTMEKIAKALDTTIDQLLK